MAKELVGLLIALRRALDYEWRQEQEDREAAWGVQVDRAVRRARKAATRTEQVFVAPPPREVA